MWNRPANSLEHNHVFRGGTSFRKTVLLQLSNNKRVGKRAYVYFSPCRSTAVDGRPPCRSTVDRLSTDCRPAVDRLSIDCRPTVGRPIGRLSTDSRLTVGGQSVDLSTDCQPTVGRLSVDYRPTVSRQSVDSRSMGRSMGQSTVGRLSTDRGLKYT